MAKNKILTEIFELIDECHGAMWPDEYDSVILSVFLLKYLNCKFEKIYNYLIKEGIGFEDDEEEYLYEDAIYLYPDSRWSAITCQNNVEEFRFSLVNAFRIIERKNPKFIKISDEIPLRINNVFYRDFIGIIEEIECNGENFWLDLYKSYLNIFKDDNHIPESFIRILADYYFSKAYSYYWHDMFVEADSFINEALNFAPDDYDSLELKFFISEEQDLWDEALICCEKLLNKQPEDYGLLKSKGFIYCQLNDCENAIKAYDHALHLYVDEYELIKDKIRCLLKFNKKYEAEEFISHILNKYPEDDGLVNGIGIVYSDLGDHVSAIKYYDKSLDIVWDSAAMNNKILSLLELYEIDDADGGIYENLMEIVYEVESKLNPPKQVCGPLICQGYTKKWHSLKEYKEYFGVD